MVTRKKGIGATSGVKVPLDGGWIDTAISEALQDDYALTFPSLGISDRKTVLMSISVAGTSILGTMTIDAVEVDLGVVGGPVVAATEVETVRSFGENTYTSFWMADLPPGASSGTININTTSPIGTAACIICSVFQLVGVTDDPASPTAIDTWAESSVSDPDAALIIPAAGRYAYASTLSKRGRLVNFANSNETPPQSALETSAEVGGEVLYQYFTFAVTDEAGADTETFAIDEGRGSPGGTCAIFLALEGNPQI